MIARLVARLEKWLCPHRTELRRVQPGRYYLECMDCRRETPGVEIAR